MLPAEHRLLPKGAITHTIRRGSRYGGARVVAHVMVTSAAQPPRFAFAVSKSVGNSVVRHRVTRRLRAASMRVAPQVRPGTDVVVRALPPAAQSSVVEFERDLTRVLSRYFHSLEATPGATAPVAVADVAAQVPIEVLPAPVRRQGMRAIFYWLTWPLQRLLLLLIRGYQRFISPALPPSCRYHPSCSAYAVEALSIHGVGKAFLLSLWRLLRCNPWSKGGLDPVPQRGSWHPDIYPDGATRRPSAVGCDHTPAPH